LPFSHTPLFTEKVLKVADQSDGAPAGEDRVKEGSKERKRGRAAKKRLLQSQGQNTRGKAENELSGMSAW